MNSDSEYRKTLVTARRRLRVDHRVMATLLGLGPDGADLVEQWERDAGK